MNYSINKLLLKNFNEQSPFLALNANLKISQISFSFSSTAFVYSKFSLHIQKSSFHHLTDQIILFSKITQTNFVCKCSSFSDISTPKTGSIFDFSGESIIVEHCSFKNITTSQSPSCFQITESKALIQHCYFDSCNACGGDKNYGNAFNAPSCHITINQVICIKCAPDQDNFGDSTISIRNGKSNDCKLMNFSHCYGYNGGLISCAYSEADDNVFSFINIENCIEFCSLECVSCKQFTLKYSNFIDSYQISNFTISNKNTTAILYYCIFINPKLPVIEDTNIITCYNCTSNENSLTQYFTFIEKQETISSFNIIINEKCLFPVTIHNNFPLFYNFLAPKTLILICAFS